MQTLSNQPHKRDIYYAISLYKNGKHIGYHNGIKKIGKIVYYVKDYIDMFLSELTDKCKINNIEIKLIEKIF